MSKVTKIPTVTTNAMSAQPSRKLNIIAIALKILKVHFFNCQLNFDVFFLTLNGNSAWNNLPINSNDFYQFSNKEVMTKQTKTPIDTDEFVRIVNQLRFPNKINRFFTISYWFGNFINIRPVCLECFWFVLSVFLTLSDLNGKKNSGERIHYNIERTRYLKLYAWDFCHWVIDLRH